MIAAPTASEPVKVIMSMRGSVVSSVPTAGPPVTMLSTPGGKPISAATSPNNSAENGVNGEGFSTSVLPASKRRHQLRQVQQKGKIIAGNAGDHADRLAHHRRAAEHLRAGRVRENSVLSSRSAGCTVPRAWNASIA